MRLKSAIAVLTLLAAQSVSISDALAFDETRFPDWKGMWVRIGSGAYDPTLKAGRGQRPPLTPEYRALWEKHLAEEAAGGQSYNTQARCLSGGMPRMMIAYDPMEIIVTPDITYIQISHMNDFRRIYTDGRAWPDGLEPSFVGYSIGQWSDEARTGRYDTLTVETKNLRGPRIVDTSGIPLHHDNKTVVTERIRLDRSNPDVLLNDITTIDNALTEPWTVTRKYRRVRNPVWMELACAEHNTYVFIRGETYFVDAEGYLMPTRKDQPPPDLRHFNSKRAQPK